MNAPLRVAVDACPLSERRTGVGNYVFELLSALCARHPDAHFYLYSNTDIHFPNRKNVTLRPNAGSWRGVFWQNFQLPTLLRKDGIDVYWGSNGFVPVVGARRPPSVVTIHDLADRFAAHTQARLVFWSRRLLQPQSARTATVVLCVSDATAADVARLYGPTAKAIIHPLVHPRFHRQTAGEISRVREKYQLPEDFLLTVGTLEPRKNIGPLINAARALKQEGVDLPLVVHVGGSGWRNEAVEKTIRDGERDGVVKRLGFTPIDDLPGLYAASTAFVMPSIYEGFGMPVLEAQLCGVPVLHGDHASMIEAGGHLGVAFAPTEVGITQALRDLATGQSALSCRLPGDIVNDAASGADILWDALTEAAQSRIAPGLG